MSETIIAVYEGSFQAWKYLGHGGVENVSLIASSEVDGDLFSREGMVKLEEFLKSLNSGVEQRPATKLKIPEFFSKVGLSKLEDLLKSVNSGEEKKPPARLILSDIDLFIRKVELPFDDLKKARLAAPSVVSSTLPFEGDFLLDLIPLHSEMGPRKFLAVCVRKEEIEQFETAFQSSGLSLEQVIPAFLLLLPSIEKMDDSWGEGIYVDDKIAVKAEPDWAESGSVRILPLSLVGEEFSGDRPSPKRVIDVSGKNSTYGTPGGGTSRGINDDMVGEYMNHPNVSGFNLISARITEMKDATEKKAKKLLLVASAVLLALSLILSIEGAKHFTRKKAESVKSAMATQFGRIMKGATMVDPVAQIKDKISSMEEELALFPEDENPFYSQLVSLSGNLKTEDDIVIREINFIKGKLTVTGEARNQESVSAFKNRLSGGEGKTVEITETGPSAVEGRIKFKLTIT